MFIQYGVVTYIYLHETPPKNLPSFVRYHPYILAGWVSGMQTLDLPGEGSENHSTQVNVPLVGDMSRFPEKGIDFSLLAPVWLIHYYTD